MRIRQRHLEDARAAVENAESVATIHGVRYFIACYCSVRRFHIEDLSGNLREALAIAQGMLAGEYGTVVDIQNEAIQIVASLQLHLGEVNEGIDSMREMLVRVREGHYVCRHANTER